MVRDDADKERDTAYPLLADGLRSLGRYSKGLLGTYAGTFSSVQTVADVYGKGARAAVIDSLESAEAAGEKIVVHCNASGKGRTGNVLALWLHHRYRLPVDQACEEVRAHAKGLGAERGPSVEAVMRMLLPSIGNGSGGGGGGGGSSSSGPKAPAVPPQPAPSFYVPPTTARSTHTPRSP